MQLMNVLVQRTPVQRPVCPVVEHVLKDKETRDLRRHKSDRREGHLVRRHAKVAANRVEEVNQGEFARKVREEDDFGAFPYLGRGDGFVLGVSAARDMTVDMVAGRTNQDTKGEG